VLTDTDIDFARLDLVRDLGNGRQTGRALAVDRVDRDASDQHTVDRQLFKLITHV
jgi:hypothetical protein